MKEIQIKDKSFVSFIEESSIQDKIKALAQEINRDYLDKRIVLLIVLKGAFRFAADLIRDLDGEFELIFIQLSSYQGTESQKGVKERLDIQTDLKNKEVLVIEDIVDTGQTVRYIKHKLNQHQVASLKFAALLLKPEKYQLDIPIDYVGFEIPNDFVVGYGLDYDEEGRGLNDIFRLKID